MEVHPAGARRRLSGLERRRAPGQRARRNRSLSRPRGLRVPARSVGRSRPRPALAPAARPLARVIQRDVRDPLTDEILFGKLEHGGTVTIDVADGALAFVYVEKALVAAGW
ncbi:MAG: hypothetical protein B7X11_05815 [Acidobacteria bacterium 37-65-4]|nr:MAG: hypothetical protein B7X11_05815 [Acidobacteria bacterium 37-65-4]